jgi:hypothetical protein
LAEYCGSFRITKYLSVSIVKSTLVVGFCVSLIACNPFDFSSPAGPVGKALHKEVREKKSVEVDFKKIVPFAWDEMYLFGPYMPREDVCKRLGLAGLQCWYHVSETSTDDGEMFLVFRLKGDIVHTEMHSRFNGDFIPMTYPQPVTPERGRFVIIEDGRLASGEPWLRLRPVKDTERAPTLLSH